MKDYAAKEFLHPRMPLGEKFLIMMILIGFVLTIGWMQQRDDEWRRIDSISLCRPAPGEIAHIAPKQYEDGYECSIKRGHTVVARFDV